MDSTSPTTGKRCCYVLPFDMLPPCVSSPPSCMAPPDSSVGASTTAPIPVSSSVHLSTPSSSVSVDNCFHYCLFVAPSSVCTPSVSPTSDDSSGGVPCALCSKATKPVVALRHHINSVHISRGCILPLSFFNVLIISFAQTLPVDLLILTSGLLVSRLS